MESVISSSNENPGQIQILQKKQHIILTDIAPLT